MATVALRDVFLYDNWPGSPNFNLGRPTNGFDSTVSGSGNNATTALYIPGEKIQVPYKAADQTRWPGTSTFIYLQFHEGTDFAQDAGDPSDGYCACFHADGTATADGSIAGPWQVTNDVTNSDATIGGAIAFACTDLSDDEFGWFWCGGVCPAYDVTRLAGEIKTGGGVTVNCKVFVEGDGTNGAALQIADATQITDTTNFNDISQGLNNVVGYSLQVDA